MSCPRHHHHQRCTHGQINQCCCCYCSCCSSNCCSANSTAPPPLTTSDHLLQALAAQILLQPHSLPTLSTHQAPEPKHHLTPLHPLFQDHHQGDAHHQQHLDQHHTYPIIHSLLGRVAALETSFPDLSSCAPPPSHHPPRTRHQQPLEPESPPPTTKHKQRRPIESASPPPLPSTFSYRSSAPTLRDIAARRIQTAFRRFLLRRSQTLRHLKDLAAMQSHVAALRSALSDKGHVDPNALAERAMNLFFRLDAIQSGDPMIRQGKRSINRELTRVLEFVDKVLVKEHQLSLDAIELAGNGINEGFFAESRRISEGAEEVLRTTKKVSFSEDGNRSRVSFSNNQFAEELSDCSDQNSRVENLSDEVARSRIKDNTAPERFNEASDDERASESSLENGNRYERQNQSENRKGKLSLSAPLPVQMEPRRK